MSANVGVAVAESLSYVTIPYFSSLDERLALQSSALALQREEAAADEDKNSTNNNTASNHVMGASQVNFNCSRYSVERLLDGPAKAVSSALLDRLLRFIQDDADLARIFASHKFKSPLPELQATWYAEPDENGVLHPEPKVNVYQQGGYFKQHTDGMQLTLLVVLNDAFEGGELRSMVIGKMVMPKKRKHQLPTLLTSMLVHWQGRQWCGVATFCTWHCQ